jgi:hypothetical protein
MSTEARPFTPMDFPIFFLRKMAPSTFLSEEDCRFLKRLYPTTYDPLRNTAVSSSFLPSKDSCLLPVLAVSRSRNHVAKFSLREVLYD